MSITLFISKRILKIYLNFFSLLSVSIGFRRPDLRIQRKIILFKRCFNPIFSVAILAVEARLSLSDENIDRRGNCFCCSSSRTVILAP